MDRAKRAAIIALALAAVLAAAGCTRSSDVPASTPATVMTPLAASTASAASPTPTGTTATATPTGAAAAARKVNANTATRAEIQAALAAAGVPNAAQWAREVEEYRPYPADDPTWAKLRKELAKYNPAPGVVDQIIAVLTP